MKLRLAIVLLIAVAASLASAQTENKPEKAKGDGKVSIDQEFKKIENTWAEADKNKDPVALGRLLADDWVYLGPLGVETKAQHLAGLKSGDDNLESITLMDMKVRVFGSIAIVTGREHEKSSSKGKDTSGDYLWTDVFVKREGQWRAVNSQDTPLTRK
jgi:ketosteroid isomerase-like protein